VSDPATVSAAPVGPAAWLRALSPTLLLFVPQLALAPALFFVGVTFLHESAHAVAALALGGTIEEFAFLPGPENLGHVRWAAPPGAPAWFGELVSVAPYVMWSVLAGIVLLLARRRVRLNRWVAAAIFYWCYFVPVGDIAWNLYGGRGDLAIGGADGVALQAVGTTAIIAAFLLGHWAQKRLLGAHAVDWRSYLACSAAIGAASAIAAAAGLALFAAIA
jgi:hypothetical protein